MNQHRLSRRSVLSSAAGLAGAAVLPAPARARLATPTGVVLLHGKAGDPVEPGSNIRSLAASLQSIGCRVVQPEMPWSKRRYMTVPYELGQDEIAAHVAQLRSHGSARVIVGGISLGANGALCYAARTSGIDGLMLFSVGQWPEYMTVHRKEFVDAAARAQDMIRAGKGGETADWQTPIPDGCSAPGPRRKCTSATTTVSAPSRSRPTSPGSTTICHCWPSWHVATSQMPAARNPCSARVAGQLRRSS